MNDSLLPLPNLDVPARHVEWLRLANAGDYPGKKPWFYPFKSRFCRAHGLADGQDLQTITLKCWCGDGIYRGRDDMEQRPKQFWEPCMKCGGTGIYLVKKILLIRWLVGGHLFHEPQNPMFVYVEGRVPIKERFDGLIKHEPVDARTSRRAMERLMLRYEPETLKRLYISQVNSWIYFKKQRTHYMFWRLNQRLRAMFGKETDQVPF